jgi:hypothetical protein
MNWPSSLPLLRLLYQASDVTSTDNYFSELASPNGYRLLAGYEPIEVRLSRLDELAFNALVQKAAPLVSERNKHGEWRPLFDALNEVYGYIHLKELGFDRVTFIPTSVSKTPDLLGVGPAGSAVLEVKCIARSDVDRANSGELTVGVKGLPLGFTKKLRSTYEEACVQLTSYMPEAAGMRRVCYFVIDVDLSCVLDRDNRIALEEYLSELASGGIEISAYSRYW